jgi:hypothetical protein
MVDTYLVVNSLAMASMPSHTDMTALDNTLDSSYDTHLPSSAITIPPLPFRRLCTALTMHLPPTP